MIRIYDDNLTIWNAGELLDPLKPEMLKQEHPSVLRNRIIAHIFYRAGYIEAWGRGTVAIVNETKQAGLKAPDYELHAGGMKLVFHKPRENVTEDVTQDVTEDVTENRRAKILKLLENNSQLSTTQLAKQIGVARRTIARDIDALKAQGRLKRIGPDKGGYWKVIA